MTLVCDIGFNDVGLLFRILCYDAGLEKAERLGEPVGEFVSEQVMGRVFAISYSETGKCMTCINNEAGFNFIQLG